MITTANNWRGSWNRIGLLALLAGLLLWLCQSTYPYLPLPALGELGISPNPVEVQKHQSAYQQFYSYNAAILFALVGASLAFALGLACAEHKLSAIFAGGLAGAILGGGGGFVAGWMVHNTTWLSQDESIVRNFAIHLVGWAPAVLGAVTGPAVLHERSSSGRLLAFSSILPALLIVSAYFLTASIFFANSNTTKLIPQDSGQRILWAASAGALFAVGFKMILDKSSSASTCKPAPHRSAEDIPAVVNRPADSKPTGE